MPVIALFKLNERTVSSYLGKSVGPRAGFIEVAEVTLAVVTV
jgi:hypothetical protein